MKWGEKNDGRRAKQRLTEAERKGGETNKKDCKLSELKRARQVISSDVMT